MSAKKKRGPTWVAKKGNVEVPIYTIKPGCLNQQYVVCHYEGGKRKRRTFSALEKAKADLDIELTTAIDHREARLKVELDRVSKDYDYIIVDCPLTLSWLTINALTASDRVIVTVSPGYFELDSIVQLSKTINEVIKYFNPNLDLLGFLFTMSEPTINTATSLQILRQTYTDKVLKTVIPKNTDLRDAHFNKKDIFAFSPKSKAALAYNKLIHELFEI